MLLSIVIPTLDRAYVLSDTLSRLAKELDWLPDNYRGQVEVIVSDNASVDHTPAVASAISNINYYRFDERLDGDGSISRAASLARGKYVWVFGDDDYLVSGGLRSILEIIIGNPGISLFYINRLILDHTLLKLVRVAHVQWGGELEAMGLSDFICRFNHWPGFITSIVFLNQRFAEGADFAKDRYAGWTQVARLLFAPVTDRVLFISYPLIGQRLGVQSWKGNWPRYWLVNMPRLLSDLESAGRTVGALDRWRTVEVGIFRLLADAFVAKAYGISCADLFWKEAIGWQNGAKKLGLICVRFLLPCFLARNLYPLLQPKYRK